jgi:hypothetical protein
MRGLTALLFGLCAAERPVMKVVRLLQDMQAQLQSEAEADAEIYKKLSCWCSTNKNDKQTTIKMGDSKSRQLIATIDTLTAQSQKLASEIAKLEQEAAKNRESLNAAAELRDKELAEFNEEHKDLLQSIKGLDAAITVLSKHHPSQEALLDAINVGKGAVHKHERMLGDVAVTAKQILNSFLQQPAGFQSHASQSGQIFGIMKQMKETFMDNADVAVKEEAQKAQSFAQLKKAKEEEIAAAKKQAQDKTTQKAETDQLNVEAQENLEDTNAKLAADRQFLADLNTKCAATDEENDARTKARNDEIAAVSEAIKILNHDSSFDLFGKTMNTPSFVQVSSNSRRAQVTALLRRAAEKTGDQQLASLAVEAKLDAFTKVKAAIDAMIKDLNTQQKDEVDHRDWCIEEFAGNDKSTAATNQEKAGLEATMEELQASTQRLTRELKEAAQAIADSQVQMKRATDDRGAANAEFQQVAADQRATQAVLQRAYDRLKQYYNPDVKVKGFNALVQQPVPGAEVAPAPAEFKEFNKNKGGNRVLSMLETILADSKQMEKEAIQDEQDQTRAYEDFIKDSNDQITALQKAISDKTGAKARADSEHIQASKDHGHAKSELATLSDYSQELHRSCDFVIDNFETRQAARAQEVEALRQAKAILSGA